MRDRDYARRSGVSPGEYIAASAVILVGFLAVLLFAAYPTLMTVAVVGVTVGAAAGRIARKARKLICLFAGKCKRPAEAGPDTA